MRVIMNCRGSTRPESGMPDRVGEKGLSLLNENLGQLLSISGSFSYGAAELNGVATGLLCIHSSLIPGRAYTGSQFILVRK